MSPLLANEPEVLPVWPAGVPDAQVGAPPEYVEDGRVYNVQVPTLRAYRPAAPNGTAVVVCPGGGYTRLAADHEGNGMARWLNSLGVTAFVLRYRMKEYGQPHPLRDAVQSVRRVRELAPEYGLDPARVGILGSSAGGHLAATASTLFDAPEARTPLDTAGQSGRPDFAILLYPVITLRAPHRHEGSARNLLGADPAEALLARWSADEQVSAATPPTFVVHTVEDPSVPVENALLYFAALRRHGVPAEVHLFEEGKHGLGLGLEGLPYSAWPELAAAWMARHGWRP